MLTVVNVAYPFAPVGPDAVGGAEQILSSLDSALAAAGHRSIVVGCEGSVTAGEFVPVPRTSGDEIDEAARGKVHAAMRQAIASASIEADLIHLHGIDFPAYLPELGKPTLITLHLPISWYPLEALRSARDNIWFNCVSESQERTCPAEVKVVATVPNGVPLASLARGTHARRRFALMLGRICPEKGHHFGLQAAHRAGVPLLLAGSVFPYPEHRAYFNDSIRPLLDHQRRYLGPVGFDRKRRLLHAAKCLLLPSLAQETSSLVAMEALACGLPVIGFPSGAIPDVIEHGRTGFLVNDVDGMAEAIGAVGSIHREECRRVAEERYSQNRMTDAYLALYQRLAA